MGSTVPPAHLWRARCRANLHAGFGGRDGETGQLERPAPRSVPTLLEPVSYGFRPKRRAHDAIAEIHYLGTRGYRWVLDADIEACFDSISHPALMDRVRVRVKDKRVLVLVKAFLKAGVLLELGEERDTPTGTPQGGSCLRYWPTSACRCSTSTCTSRGSQAGAWKPNINERDCVPRNCRPGDWSGTATTLSSWSTGVRQAPRHYAKRSPMCWPRWAFGSRMSRAESRT